MKSDIYLIYGHDTLCGWCYGLIPTLRAFAGKYPQIPIEVVSGGLFSGNRVRPYPTMFEYIEGAFTKVKAKTRRHAEEQFFKMMNAPETGLIASAKPTYALMQLKRSEPNRVVEFAHALQEAHFEQGRSLNDPNIYSQVLESLNLTNNIDSKEIESATDNHPLVRESYARSAELDIWSYPTCLVVDGNDKRLGIISGIYEPDEFILAFEKIINADNQGYAVSIAA